jgi:hypothetical protein
VNSFYVYIHTYIYIYIYIFYNRSEGQNKKRGRRKRKNNGVDDLKSWAWQPSQNSVPWTGVGGQC